MIFWRVTRGVFPMFGDRKTTYHSLYIDNLFDAFIGELVSQRGVSVVAGYCIGQRALNE